MPCPSIEILALLAERWTLPILVALRAGARRNSELRQEITGITQKELTKKLQALERNGLVLRAVHMEVRPRVVYTLSELGQSLETELTRLDAWVMGNLSALASAQRAYETNLTARNPWQVARVS